MSQITIDAPTTLNSYSSDNADYRVFYWAYDNSNQGYGYKIFIRGGTSFPGVGWVPTSSSTGTISYDTGGYITSLTGNTVLTEFLDGSSFNPFFDITKLILSDSDGNYSEFVLKLVSGINGNVTIDSFGNSLEVYSDHVVFNGTSYSVTTTDDYHSYIIVSKDGKSSLYIDNIIVLDDISYTLSKTFTFGQTSTDSSNSLSMWKYVKLGNGEYFPILLSNLDYDILVDTDTSFSSINLRSYKLSTFSGDKYLSDFVFGFSDIFPIRQISDKITYYWKVRANSSYYISDWSEVQTFVVEQNTYRDIFNRIYNKLPDDNSYAKDYSTGTLSIIFKSVARELDSANYAILKSMDDLSYLKTRDSSITSIAGNLLDVNASSFTTPLLYKNYVIKSVPAFLRATTKYSVNSIISSIVGVNPLIEEVVKEDNWIVNTSSSVSRFYLYDSNYPGLPAAQIFSTSGHAFTWRLHIFNPYNVSYDATLIYNTINKIKPANTEVYFYWYDSNGNQLPNPITPVVNKKAIKVVVDGTTKEVIDVGTVAISYGSGTIETLSEGVIFYKTETDGSGAFYGVSRDSSGNLQVVAL